MNFFLRVSFLWCVCSIPLNAQTYRIKNLPRPYFKPIDHSSAIKYNELMLKEWDKDKRENWLILSDRPSNVLYNKPGGIENGQVLEFKETAFVIEEKGDWIRIAAGGSMPKANEINFPKKSGWINKKNVLLWPYCMVDENSNISRKGFLLHKYSELGSLRNQSAKNFRQISLYEGPDITKEISQRNIKEVFFIYKKEGTRVLLGIENSIKDVNAQNVIIGWVDNTKIEKWNQRLALECSFDEVDFIARKNDPNKQIVGFRDPIDVMNFNRNFIKDESTIIWDNDPVKINPNSLAKTNRNRVIGNIFRFPIYEVQTNYYRTGVLNVITQNNEKDDTGVDLNKMKSELAVKRDNVNIYLLLEGTQVMQEYRNSINDIIKNITTSISANANVRIGAMIYRDCSLKDRRLNYNFKSMTKNGSGLEDWFINQDFLDHQENLDQWTNQRFALQELLKIGGFSDKEQNIILVIGAHADFYNNRPRRITNSCPDELVNDEKHEKIIDDLIKLGVNLGFYQIKNNEGSYFSKFAEDGRSYMVPMVQDYTSVSKHIETGSISVPELEDNNELIFNGQQMGYIIRPPMKSSLDNRVLVEAAASFVLKSHKRYAKAVDALEEAIAGKKLKLGDEFAPIIWSMLEQKIKRKEIEEDFLTIITKERIPLFLEIFLPRSIPGLKNTYKPVIFMPKVELEEYIRTLKNVEAVSNLQNETEIRNALYQAFLDTAIKLTGDSKYGKNIDGMSLDDFSALLAGISKEGLDIQKECKYKISDIRDRKAIQFHDIKNIIKNISEIRIRMTEISNLGKNYDFSYTATEGGNAYFWIDYDLMKICN